MRLRHLSGIFTARVHILISNLLLPEEAAGSSAAKF